MIRKALDFQRRLTGEGLFATGRRYATFLVGGTTGWLILIGLHTFLKGYGFNPLVSYAAGLVFADVFTFVFHKIVTFKIHTNWEKRFIQFSALVIAVSVANWGLFYVGRQVLDLQVWDFVMSFVITGFLSVVNFGVNRVLIFRRR